MVYFGRSNDFCSSPAYSGTYLSRNKPPNPETREPRCFTVIWSIYLLQLKKGGVAKAKGEGEKEKCTTECKSRRRRDEKAPWALHYESGEGGGDAKGRRRGGEKRAMYV